MFICRHDGNAFVPIFQKVMASITEHSRTSIENIEENFLDYDGKLFLSASV